MNALLYRFRWQPVWAAFGLAAVVAMIGVLMTDLGPWYAQLQMPAWKPPDALFGPAWTLIFACAALAGALAWQALPQRSPRLTLCLYFAANALLNVLWSALFFRLHRPDLALLEVGLLWVSIIVLMVTLAPASRWAAILLVPYLAWVSFAAFLNLAVVRLNGAALLGY
jgi:tryptophan-rich sensory protein